MPDTPEHKPTFTLTPEAEGPTTGGGEAELALQRGDLVFGFAEDGSRITLQVGINSQGAIVLFDPDTGRAFPGVGGQFLTADNKVFELDAQGRIVSAPRTLTKSERDALGLGIGPTGGAGGSAGRSLAEERALREETRAFTLKRDRLQQAASLTRDIIGLQAQAKELVAETFGRDPFRGAIQAQGRLPRGRSPFAAFQGQLRETATQQIPQAVSGESPEQLTARIAALEAQAFEQLPRAPLGLAHGGVISPAPGEGVLVGEAGRPEVIRPMPDGGFEVIPLAASAQGGAQVESPFGALTNVQIADALGPAFAAVGLTAAPVGGRHAFGQFAGPFAGTGRGLPTPQPSLGAETFEALGTLPSLIQMEGRNEFFFRDPKTGAISKIGGLADVNAIGFSPQDAVVLAPGEIGELGRFSGERFTGGDFVQPGRPFAARTSPIFLPLGTDEAGLPDPSSGGLFLPDPRMLAGVWNQWDPGTQELVASAYEFAGVSREKLARDIDFFGRSGSAFTSAALR